ncbi:MAG: aminotransferase class V-fold PLP-dependent enzyme, partial [Pseudomonadota bacterium]|nr:aminotransferase class V-fold PLP-dependent enzyme [Pseudomonadota bacterium]
AWKGWLEERERFRSSVARLIKAPGGDCIVPKSSAGQGLRAVLNSYDRPIEVLTTKDEFDSVDFILKVYARRGRINLRYARPDSTAHYGMEQLLGQLAPDLDLIVISLVMFTTGQLMHPLRQLVDKAHAMDIRVLIDLYHGAGVVPIDILDLGADFAIGGCYKYLRGGPGTGWLYVHPGHLERGLRTLDTGWYAQPNPFEFNRNDETHFAPGGNAWLESTPAVVPYFQARAGLAFTEAIGVERLREYSIRQQDLLQNELAALGVPVSGYARERGAFLSIRLTAAANLVQRLRRAGILADARSDSLRLCPDILNRERELRATAEQIARLIARG